MHEATPQPSMRPPLKNVPKSRMSRALKTGEKFTRTTKSIGFAAWKRAHLCISTEQKFVMTSVCASL